MTNWSQQNMYRYLIKNDLNLVMSVHLCMLPANIQQYSTESNICNSWVFVLKLICLTWISLKLSSLLYSDINLNYFKNPVYAYPGVHNSLWNITLIMSICFHWRSPPELYNQTDYAHCIKYFECRHYCLTDLNKPYWILFIST